MSDRELLELAAKAAGIESSIGLLPKDGVSIIQPSGDKWNPITDDGDALRLAVKLKITVSWDFRNGCYYATSAYLNTNQGYFGIVDPADPGDATRRVIVHAAAEIGRQMK